MFLLLPLQANPLAAAARRQRPIAAGDLSCGRHSALGGRSPIGATSRRSGRPSQRAKCKTKCKFSSSFSCFFAAAAAEAANHRQLDPQLERRQRRLRVKSSQSLSLQPAANSARLTQIWRTILANRRRLRLNSRRATSAETESRPASKQASKHKRTDSFASRLVAGIICLRAPTKPLPGELRRMPSPLREREPSRTRRRQRCELTWSSSSAAAACFAARHCCGRQRPAFVRKAPE